MFYNIVKKEVTTNNYVKIVKTYRCYGLDDYDIKYRAERRCGFYNLFRYINNKYYYVVELDFE